MCGIAGIVALDELAGFLQCKRSSLSAGFLFRVPNLEMWGKVFRVS
jgi:hypothetical protein